MQALRIAHGATIALVASGVGLGAAAGAKSAMDVVEAKGDDASSFTTLGTKLGLPLVGVAPLVVLPDAVRAGALPAALLGAIGIGTISGIFAAALD